MTFTRYKSSWNDGEQLPAAAVNQWEGQFENALDGYAGGPYSPLSAIVINGSGLQVGGNGLLLTSLTTMSATASLTAASGSSITVQSGSEMDVASGGRIDIEGANGLLINSGGEEAVQSGGTLAVESGGTLALETGCSMTVADRTNVALTSFAGKTYLYPGPYGHIVNWASFWVPGTPNIGYLSQTSVSTPVFFHLHCNIG